MLQSFQTPFENQDIIDLRKEINTAINKYLKKYQPRHSEPTTPEQNSPHNQPGLHKVISLFFLKRQILIERKPRGNGKE